MAASNYVERKEYNTNKSDTDNLSRENMRKSKDLGQQEEAKQADRTDSIVEAIENHTAYKRLKHSLARSRNDNIKVSVEDIAEIYKGLVSTSVNARGDEGVFVVDDGIVTQAIGGMCYDLTKNENIDIALKPNGEIDLAATVQKRAALDIQIKDDISNMQQKQDAFQNQHIENNIFNNDKAEKMSKIFSGLSDVERKNILEDKNVIEQLEQITKTASYNEGMKSLKDEGFIDTPNKVEIVHIEGIIYKFAQTRNQTSSVEERQAFSKIIIGHKAMLKKLADAGNEEAAKLLDDNGEIDLGVAMKEYEDRRDIYSIRKDLQFFQKFPIRELSKYQVASELTTEQIAIKKEMIERALSIYFSKDSRADKGAAFVFLSTLGLTDGKTINSQKIVEEYNKLVARSEVTVDENGNKIAINMEDILRRAVDRHDKQWQAHIEGLNDQRINGTLKYDREGTILNLDEKAENKFQSRKDLKSIFKEMYERGKNDSIAKTLDTLFSNTDLEDYQKSAVMAKVFLNNIDLYKEANKSKDTEAISKYKEILVSIKDYMRMRPEVYKSLFGSSGLMDLKKVEEVINGELLGPEASQYLAEKGLTDENITKIFEQANNKNKKLMYYSQGFAKEAKNFTKTLANKLKSNRVGRFFLGDIKENIKGLLPSGRKKEAEEIEYEELLEKIRIEKSTETALSQEEIDELFKGGKTVEKKFFRHDQIKAQRQKESEERMAKVSTQRVLSQEEIDAYFAMNLEKPDKIEDELVDLDKFMSKYEKEKNPSVEEKSFDEQLKVGAHVDERLAIQKMQEDQAVVDEKILRKLAFEVCQKNNLDPLQVNTAKIEDLMTLVNFYGDELTNLMQTQSEQKTATEGAER